jgi:hypothetical protein
MIMFHVPDDKELLAAFGEMALRHEHLNYILRMTIKTLAQLTQQEALDATANEGSGQLRNRIRKLARQRLGEGQPLCKLQALMQRCQRVTDKRNELVHCVWAKELDGEAQLRNADHLPRPLPTKQELSDLSNKIRDLTNALIQARSGGFLSEALSKRTL